MSIDELRLPPPIDLGDYRRERAREVANAILAQLEANGIEPELLAEIEEIFQDSGMLGASS